MEGKKPGITLYAEKDSARWQYITTILFRDICGVTIQHTCNRDHYLAAEGAKINYSLSRIAENEFFLPPVDLLFETGIHPQQINVEQVRDYPAFFTVAESDFSFDIFAAAFYLLSRYEEYLPHQKDTYGRYDPVQSLAYREGFLDRPLINYWLQDFRIMLTHQFPQLIMPVPVFRFMPTYDIDVAYAYLCRGLKRTILGAGQSLVSGNLADCLDRYKVITGKKKDPYDVYEWLDALHLKYRLRPHYFFLLAAKQQGYDKNVDPEEKAFRDLVHYHAMGYPVGLHPSWQSGDNKALLREEKEQLEKLAGKKVISSRQHYIRLSLPDTYRSLIDLGIESDFSMGYGSVNGFRASISSPFNWYDLEKEQMTSLKIYPFCFMDANALFEQKLTPAQAFEQIRHYHDTVKKVNGTLITIWHNSFFSDQQIYKGWKEVYGIFLDEVVYWDL